MIYIENTKIIMRIKFKFDRVTIFLHQQGLILTRSLSGSARGFVSLHEPNIRYRCLGKYTQYIKTDKRICKIECKRKPALIIKQMNKSIHRF